MLFPSEKSTSPNTASYEDDIALIMWYPYRISVKPVSKNKP